MWADVSQVLNLCRQAAFPSKVPARLEWPLGPRPQWGSLIGTGGRRPLTLPGKQAWLLSPDRLPPGQRLVGSEGLWS